MHLRSFPFTQNNLSTPPPLVSISPFECTRLQEEELETLRAIYEEDLHCLSECCFVIIVRYLTDDIRDEDVIKVWFRYSTSCTFANITDTPFD